MAVPTASKAGHLVSQVNYDVHSGVTDHDHSMTQLRVDITIPADVSSFHCRPTYDRFAMMIAEGRSKCAAIWQHAPRLDATVDPSLHCAVLERCLQQSIQRAFPLNRRQNKKDYISDSTYSLLCLRRGHRRDLRSAQGWKAPTSLAP